VLLVGELLTGERIQHPGWDGHLYVIREPDDHAVRRVASEPPNDRYGFAVEGMVAVVNDRGGQFMGSVRMRCSVCTLFISPSRLIRSAIVLKPSTLVRLHRALTQRKYRRLFSSTVLKKPGPKGPTQEVIAAVVEMKQRNPTWGCPRIAQQIALAFGISLNKDVVRRILAVRYQPTPDAAGPSWLTVLGHAKDSLWSLDLFRCESAVLHTHWVLVVMDQWTRRIVGFGVHRGVVDGVALCRMFNRAIGRQPAPTYLSSDHDPLYRFHQWQADLQILDVKSHSRRLCSAINPQGPNPAIPS
jgi:putative transposase